MKYKFVSVFFSQRGIGHVKLTTKNTNYFRMTSFYVLSESWARRIEYINSWGISSKINRAVTIFNFNWWLTNSPIQITIHEIRHLPLMTELLLLPYTLHFFASLFGGTLVYHGITVPLVLTSFGERRPPKIRRGTVFPRVPPRLHHLRRLLFSNP